MTGFVAMPATMGPWVGGEFDGAVCVLAGNPGPMTLDGTNTWLLDVDAESVILVDPGPDDPAHLQAVRGAVGERWVRDIVLTHGHLDHSAGANLFAEAFGAAVRALDPQPGHERLAPGAVLEYPQAQLHVVSTPGHTHDSVSLYLPAATRCSPVTRSWAGAPRSWPTRMVDWPTTWTPCSGCGIWWRPAT